MENLCGYLKKIGTKSYSKLKIINTESKETRTNVDKFNLKKNQL